MHRDTCDAHTVPNTVDSTSFVTCHDVRDYCIAADSNELACLDSFWCLCQSCCNALTAWGKQAQVGWGGVSAVSKLAGGAVDHGESPTCLLKEA